MPTPLAALVQQGLRRTADVSTRARQRGQWRGARYNRASGLRGQQGLRAEGLSTKNWYHGAAQGSALVRSVDAPRTAALRPTKR
jgi:hypothetical protein